MADPQKVAGYAIFEVRMYGVLGSWHSPGPTSTIVFGCSSATIGALMTREAISTSAAATVVGPYSQAIVAGGFVFCSGTAGIDPDTGEVREGVRAQTEQALTNLAAILQAAGTSMDAVVKTTIFYTNVDDFATINEIYARRMPDPPPARSAPANIELPRGLLVSIEAIAVLPDTV